jgi:hypothetical protein
MSFANRANCVLNDIFLCKIDWSICYYNGTYRVKVFGFCDIDGVFTARYELNL